MKKIDYDIIGFYCTDCGRQATESELACGVCSDCGAVIADELDR